MSIATPIAGVIGFALQIRQIKKVRLENAKLQLEIAALRKQAIDADRRIVLATNEETQRISRREVLYSRQCHSSAEESLTAREPKSTFRDYLILVALIGLALLFLSYLVYDLYRAGVWLVEQL